jgi:hypothetical protein
MVEIKEVQLQQIQGIKPEQIPIIKELFDNYEELLEVSVENLVKIVKGFDLSSAEALIGFAKMKCRKITTVAQPAMIENVLVTNKNNVATKKRTLLDQSVAKGLGLNVTTQYYSKCSACDYNLSTYAEQEEIRLDDIDICPNCNLEFVMEQQLNCYACLKKLPSKGKCLTCGCSASDSEEDKMKIIFQLENGKSLQMAKLEKNNITLTPKIIAVARQEKWIEKREQLNSTGGANPNTNLGYNFRNSRSC